MISESTGVRILVPGSDDTRAELLRRLLQRSLDVPCTIGRFVADAANHEALRVGAGSVGIMLLGRDRVAAWLERVGGSVAAVSEAPVIAVAEQPTADELVGLLRAGFADYILPPFDAAHVVPRVVRLLPKLPTRAGQRPVAVRPTGLIGNSAAFAAEADKLPIVARSHASVLIDGETGTGKEVFARAIHELSPRSQRPFVPVNCGAVPVALAESELFGHERGAFTGAYAAQKGVVAQAEGGTLFLDEVASLPLAVQVKLLRFLQEGEYRPVGAAGLRKADVRVVAAANTRLDRAVRDGGFRADLFYRLNVIRISLPPLRARREDILPLARHFLERYSVRAGGVANYLGVDAAEKLVHYDWPGNVRELEHVIERATVFASGAVISPAEIMLDDDRGAGCVMESFKQAKARAVAAFESSYIETLLAANCGNISQAARRAGKNRRAFWELIRKNGVDPGRFRPFGTV